MNLTGYMTALKWPFVVFCVTALIGCGLEAKTADMSDKLWASQQQSAKHFLDAVSNLAISTGALCQIKSGKQQEEKTKQAWLNAVTAWAPLQGANVGNAKAAALSWQIQFFPDKKNTTGRKMSRLIQSGGPYSVASLSNESVAVQGLGAMEWLLFDPSNMKDVKTHCSLMVVTSKHLVNSAEALVTSWEINPWGQTNKNQLEADALRLLTAQLETAIKSIEIPMGKPGYPKPYQAPFWRSQQSLTATRENIAHLRTLYEQIMRPVLIDNGHPELAKRLSVHWLTALESIPEGEGLKALLDTKAGYRDLITLLNNLEYINIALREEVGPALGMIVGFNSTDGD
ncbi:imelysin family protein [Enterovibrio sp. ZSDZ35]|uniref:Imelysin family protein n=1 Tax=Enterovibrio qingdaonensis TaxID=2899818 RepID=A0ABT5QQ74_9GAMM|nr:imelysin family protein [Enterovibrio sp. ZSDZ35]MDD1782838.1 imelysin family protein [Enterovibrio sp. ZSDZ35]